MEEDEPEMDALLETAYLSAIAWILCSIVSSLGTSKIGANSITGFHIK